MANGQVQRVLLEISGPIAIVPDNILAFANDDETWMDLFQRELGLLIPVGYRLRSSQFRRTRQNRMGHTAGRTDQIRGFIDGFRTRRRLYKVTLYNPNERRGRRAVRRNHQPLNQPIINVREQVRARLRNFSNHYLQRVQAEIHALRRNGTWMRNVQRAPLSSYFLEEILRRT